MSDLDPRPQEVHCASSPGGPAWALLEGRDVVLGGTRAMGMTAGLSVRRTLPDREHRMVGAWCFLDHFGPSSGDGMRIPPHPHTGLQTVTWLLDGRVRHRDSLASDQLIRPGQLNLMTAGRGIAHTEVSEEAGGLHGVQLWVALPDPSRRVDPHFEHHAELPTLVTAGLRASVLLGTLAGITSPARTYSPLVGAEITLTAAADLPLEPRYEYGLLALDHTVLVSGESLPVGPLLYLGQGRDGLRLAPGGPAARVLLLGGEPFGEEIVMWWNFVGRGHDEIVADREDWMAGRRFGLVPGFDGEPLPAPQLPSTRLRPRPARRT